MIRSSSGLLSGCNNDLSLAGYSTDILYYVYSFLGDLFCRFYYGEGTGYYTLLENVGVFALSLSFVSNCYFYSSIALTRIYTADKPPGPGLTDFEG